MSAAPMSSLPLEILVHIFRYLRWDDPEALDAVALTCHYFRWPALQAKKKSVTIGLANDKDFDDALAIVTDSSDIISRLQRICIFNTRRDDRRAEGLLMAIIKHAHSLQLLKWNTFNFPINAFRALEHHQPQARLAIDSIDFLGHPLDGPPLVPPGLRCLSSFSCSFHPTEAIPKNDRELQEWHLNTSVMQFICSSPHLKKLRLHFPSVDRGIARWAYDKRSTDPIYFLPKVEYLSLQSDIGTEDMDDLMDNVFAGFSGTWKRAFQWNCLKHLDLEDMAIPDFMIIAAGKLPHLESLGLFWSCSQHPELNHFSAFQEFIDFMKRIDSLRSFSTTFISRSLFYALCQLQGCHLRKLKVHDVSEIDTVPPVMSQYYHEGQTHPTRTRSYFTKDIRPEDLVKERLDSFPQLQSLEISHTWKGSWPKRLVKIAASLPCLETLTVSIVLDQNESSPFGKAECRSLYLAICKAKSKLFDSYEVRVSEGELTHLASLYLRVEERLSGFEKNERDWLKWEKWERWDRVGKNDCVYACHTIRSPHATVEQVIEKLSITKVSGRYGWDHDPLGFESKSAQFPANFPECC